MPTGKTSIGYVQGKPETAIDMTGHSGLCFETIGGCTGKGLPPPPPPPTPDPPDLPPDMGGSGGDGSGNSGGCIFELGCGGGSTSSGSSGYPANAPSAPVSCETACQFAIWVLIVGFNYFVPPSIGADPEIAALELEKNQNAGEAESEEGLPCSFTASTPVATEPGKQTIGSWKTDEKVVSYHPKTKHSELEVIRHVWINHDDDLVDVTLTTKLEATRSKPAHQSSETLHTNKKHPFLSVEKGFVPAGQLKLEMHVVEADGRVDVVTGWKSVPGVQTMYNLEVTQDHTYTVGGSEFVVHNSNCVRTASQAAADLAAGAKKVFVASQEAAESVFRKNYLELDLKNTTGMADWQVKELLNKRIAK